MTASNWIGGFGERTRAGTRRNTTWTKGRFKGRQTHLGLVVDEVVDETSRSRELTEGVLNVHVKYYLFEVEMAAVAELNGLGVNIMGCYEYCFDVQMGTSLKWSTLAGMCARASRRSIAQINPVEPRLAYEGGVF